MAYYNNRINVSIRQFLDAFDLCLQKDEESKDGRRDGTRGIYSKKKRKNVDGEKVGTFHINFLYDNRGNKYSTGGYLYARVIGGTLTAQIESRPCDNDFFDIFNTINFNFSNGKGKEIKGDLVIVQDREGCYHCGVNLNCSNDTEHAEILLNHENILFGAKITKPSHCEKISFDFSKPSGNSIIHEIGNYGTLDNIENSPIYKRIEMTKIGNEDGPIILERIATANGEYVDGNFAEFVQPELTGKDSSSKKMIYAGRKLYEVDSEIGDTIRRIVSKSFKAGEVKVIENLASICYKNHEPRGIDALLGISVVRPYYLRDYGSTDDYHRRNGSRR